MRALTIAATGALLSGCTTLAGMQERSPEVTYSSAKSAAELEGCIAAGLSGLGTPSIIRGPERTTLSYGNPNPAILVTLAEAGASSTGVEVRSMFGLADGYRLKLTACL